MARPRRNRTGMIKEVRQRRSTFWKRRKTILRKARKISERTGASVTVVVESSTGKTSYCSYPPGEEIKSVNTPGEGWGERVKGWVEKECDPCTRKEDLESLIEVCDGIIVRARKKLEDLGNKPSVGGDSGVGMDCYPGTSPDEEVGFIPNPDAYRSRFGTPKPW